MINPDLFEPITYENLHELEPGEWICDDKPIRKREHCRSWNSKYIDEPIGFRQIDILDTSPYLSKPFMLTNGKDGKTLWEYFQLGRFYRFKRG